MEGEEGTSPSSSSKDKASFASPRPASRSREEEEEEKEEVMSPWVATRCLERQWSKSAPGGLYGDGYGV